MMDAAPALIEQSERLVHWLARRFRFARPSLCDVDDLCQVGRIAIWRDGHTKGVRRAMSAELRHWRGWSHSTPRRRETTSADWRGLAVTDERARAQLEAAADARELLERLPPRDRELALEHFGRGVELRDLARLHACSAQTVWTRCRAALRRMARERSRR